MRPLVLLLLPLLLLATLSLAIPSRKDTPFPVASQVRYHLPKDLAKQAGCLSHADGPRCCPAPSYKPAWQGSLVPFKPEEDGDTTNPAFGVQRCLRETSCIAEAPLLKNPGTVHEWQKSRIAMVMMREKSISAYAQHAEAVNAAWASKWGYSLIVVELAQDVPCERSISWERVEIVRRLLPNHDYVFFVDADLVVIDHTTPWFENIIKQFPTNDLILCKDSGFVMPDPARGIGGASFANFGAFILKNSAWTSEFISQWWELGNVHPKYQFSDPYEQAAFGDWYGNRRQANDVNWMSHIVVMDTQAFNSLDPFYSTHHVDQPVIHTTMRLPRMRETLLARIHAGLCAQDPHFYVNKTWMEKLVHDDAAVNAKKQKDSAEAQMIYAASLQGRGQNEKAIPFIQRAVELKPDDVYYRSALGSAYETEKKYKEALVQFDKALSGEVQLTSIVRKRSTLLVKMGKVKKAIRQLEERMKDDPDPFPSIFQMGTTLLKEKIEYPKAAELLEKAVKLNPDSASAALNLGIAYQELRLFPKALEAFEKVLKMPETDEREHERVMVSKMRIYVATNKPHEAIKNDDEHARKYPTSNFRTYMRKLRNNAIDMLNDS